MIKNVVVFSDIHAGCQMALCPIGGVTLQEAGKYSPSPAQKRMWKTWDFFWEKWIPEVTQKEPFAVVFNGDAIDGVHHNSVTQISHNLVDQRNIAKEILEPIVDRCAKDKKGVPYFYMIGGTEVHDGKSQMEAETLGQILNAMPDQYGRYCRNELFLEVGGVLCHFMHHIGSTSSAQHEASAINAELTREIYEAGRWGEDIPSIVVRSHRHRYMRVTGPAKERHGRHVESLAFTTPAWQLKTPFTYRIAGARLSPPQLGGAIIRAGDEDVYARHFTRILERKVYSETVRL